MQGNPRPDPGALRLARTLARAALEKKAGEVRILHLGALSSITDFFVLATTGSPRQTRGLASALNLATRSLGRPNGAMDGDPRSSWVVLDFGEVMVHIQTEEARKFYALDQLWADAPEIDLEDAA
ncbi:MAG: ribosome silencing factor [Planctomycetota bacterium]